MKILVIAPHPDDEVLGCGGTLKKLADSGNEIHLVIVTKGYTPDWSEKMIKTRPDKVKKAAELLGISEISFLNFPTAKIDLVGLKELSDKLTSIGRRFKPDRVFIPFWGDLHQDHQLISKASLIAFRPMNSFVEVLAYETPSETEWGILPFKPNLYSDISGVLDVKLEAMKVYDDELKKAPHPRSLETIESLAKKRGSEINRNCAEAFVLVRMLL